MFDPKVVKRVRCYLQKIKDCVIFIKNDTLKITDIQTLFLWDYLNDRKYSYDYIFCYLIELFNGKVWGKSLTISCTIEATVYSIWLEILNFIAKLLKIYNKKSSKYFLLNDEYLIKF